MDHFSALSLQQQPAVGMEQDADDAGAKMEHAAASTAADDDDDLEEEESQTKTSDMDPEAVWREAAESSENLVMLATEGRLDVLRAMVLADKRSVNERDTNGYTALMAAASYGRLEVLQYLLQHPDIDVGLADVEGDTALHYCTSVACMQALVGAGGDLQRKNNDDLTPLESMQAELDSEDNDPDDRESRKLRAVADFLASLSTSSPTSLQ